MTSANTKPHTPRYLHVCGGEHFALSHARVGKRVTDSYKRVLQEGAGSTTHSTEITLEVKRKPHTLRAIESSISRLTWSRSLFDMSCPILPFDSFARCGSNRMTSSIVLPAQICEHDAPVEQGSASR
jgi:hypothetical protein